MRKDSKDSSNALVKFSHYLHIVKNKSRIKITMVKLFTRLPIITWFISEMQEYKILKRNIFIPAIDNRGKYRGTIINRQPRRVVFDLLWNYG